MKCHTNKWGIAAGLALATQSWGNPLPIPQSCVMLSFCPESLVASGVTATEAADLLAEMSALVGEREALQGRLDEAQAAMLALVQAQVATQVGQSSEIDLEVAQDQQQAAQAALNEAVDELWTEVTDQLATSKRLRLSAWRANAVSRLPAEFRVVAWSNESRRDLERALIAERRSQVTGRSLDYGTAQLLNSARSRVDVAEASTWIQTRLAEVSQVFNED